MGFTYLFVVVVVVVVVLLHSFEAVLSGKDYFLKSLDAFRSK